MCERKRKYNCRKGRERKTNVTFRKCLRLLRCQYSCKSQLLSASFFLEAVVETSGALSHSTVCHHEIKGRRMRFVFAQEIDADTQLSFPPPEHIRTESLQVASVALV